jgi:cyclopropane fatty-acyl-phospholipid synthase-like methyltransferase
MGYLDYYHYQAVARGVHSLDDIVRDSGAKAYVYDRIILPWLPKEKSSAIGEIACGHGSLLWWLRQRQYLNMIGIDASAEQIALARLTGATVVEMDLGKWLKNQPDASLEAMVGIDLIEHISKDEFMDLLLGCQRVLRTGGRLILRYPNGDSPLVGRNLFNDVTHVWTYTSNCLQSLAAMHGFSGACFTDESEAAIRDNRWLKVPLCRLSTLLLRILFRAATKEKVDYWSPYIWACLQK